MAEGLAPPSEQIREELQADSVAGVWARSTCERRMFDNGDVEEAPRAAAAVGDARIQAQPTGRINPETWTHGSSEQRATWFARGFESGDPRAACDTFAATPLKRRAKCRRPGRRSSAAGAGAGVRSAGSRRRGGIMNRRATALAAFVLGIAVAARAARPPGT
jgi:Putative neutral zinc metallopeptidase